MILNNDVVEYIQDEENKIEYLRFKPLEKYGDVDALYTLSSYGVDFRRPSHAKYVKNVEDESLNRLEKSLNIDKNNILVPKQTHSDNIVIIDSNNKNENFEDVDAFITKEKNVVLALTYADCTPILLYDAKNKVIANAHSGWKGTIQEIGKKTALKMMEEFGSKAEDIIALIGPCISKNNFEVKNDVRELFLNAFKDVKEDEYIVFKGLDEENNEKFLIDSTYVNIKSLESIGLKRENIYSADTCTVDNHNIMHSYRADKDDSGRNYAIIYLK